MAKKMNSFFTLYDDALKDKHWNCVTLSKKLVEHGFDITPRSLQRYRNKEMRPNYETAKAIYQFLGVDLTDSEIQNSLERSKEKRYLERPLRIKISKLSDTIEDDGEILEEIKKRINETQPLKTLNFNRYVADLIKKDLAYHILPTVEKTEEDF